MAVDQCRQQAQQTYQHGEGGQQALRKEEVAEQHEKAQKKHHKGVAPGAQLQRFKRQQNHNKSDTGVASQDRFVGGIGGTGGQQQQAH